MFKKKQKTKVGDIRCDYGKNSDGSVLVEIYIYGYKRVSHYVTMKEYYPEWIFIKSVTGISEADAEYRADTVIGAINPDYYTTRPGLIGSKYVRS